MGCFGSILALKYARLISKKEMWVRRVDNSLILPPLDLRLVGSGCCNTYGDFKWTPTPGNYGYEIHMEGFFGGGCLTGHGAVIEGQVGRGRVQAFGLCLGSQYNVRIRGRRGEQFGDWSPSIRIRL